MKATITKDGPELILTNAVGDVAKYDLRDRSYTSPYGNKVQCVRRYFRNHRPRTMIDNMEKGHLREWLLFCYRQTNGHTVNLGSVMDMCTLYAEFEQYFARGVEVAPQMVGRKLSNGLLKTAKEYNFKINQNDLDLYKTVGHNMFPRAKAMCLNANRFKALVDEFDYDPKMLMDYHARLRNFEGISTSWLLGEIYDYATEASLLYDGKFRKYPKNFLTVKQIVDRTYRLQVDNISKKGYRKRVKECPMQEAKVDGFTFFIPSAEKLLCTGSDHRNCLASYLRNVSEKRCWIVLMTSATMKDVPLEDTVIDLAIEVSCDKGLVALQIAGESNREPEKNEAAAIEKYLVRQRENIRKGSILKPRDPQLQSV